jgi:HEPN domain-containing protein
VQRIDPATLKGKDRAEWERLYGMMAARAAGPLDVQDLQHEYFRTALEYYVAARFSALSFFMPMSGVMFHQAIELYLKGLLCPLLNEKKRRKLGHNLRRAWKKYKSLSKDSSLSRFDDRVAGLDRHWGVRYPDEIVRHGVDANIAFEKSPAAGTTYYHQTCTAKMENGPNEPKSASYSSS